MARTGKYAQLTVAAWDAERAKVKAKVQGSLTNSPAETAAPIAADPEGYGYEELTKDELVEELKVRNLPHTGNKEDLIIRLEEDDDEAGLQE